MLFRINYIYLCEHIEYMLSQFEMDFCVWDCTHHLPCSQTQGCCRMEDAAGFGLTLGLMHLKEKPSQAAELWSSKDPLRAARQINQPHSVPGFAFVGSLISRGKSTELWNKATPSNQDQEISRLHISKPRLIYNKHS